MLRTVLELARPVIVAALAAVAAEGCIHNHRPTVTPKEAYEMKLQACVLQAKTLEESRACRRAVDREYGVRR